MILQDTKFIAVQNRIKLEQWKQSFRDSETTETFRLQGLE
jgi:hypothetical protein